MSGEGFLKLLFLVAYKIQNYLINIISSYFCFVFIFSKPYFYYINCVYFVNPKFLFFYLRECKNN